MNIQFTDHPQLAAQSGRALVRIVIVGHVDHGKSTLIGRLLHETGGLAEGKLESLQAVSARRGMPFEWSFLIDALQSERDQRITIDTSQIRFRTPTRDIVLIDAPGHAEFLRHMITGAAQADAAILIIDAAEGVRDQTRRHGYLLHLLGVRQVAVVVNKMDRVEFAAARFEEIRAEIVDHLAGVGITPTAVIPISARHGDGVARRTAPLAWHHGPTVIEALDAFAPARSARELALRLPVQAIYDIDDRHILAGRIESGRIAVGDDIVIMPGHKAARVRSIESWPVADAARMPRTAVAGRSIGITLDRDVFVERGNVVAAAGAPPGAGRRLRARIFWLHPTPLEVGARVTIRIGTGESAGTIGAIEDAIDPGDIRPTGLGAIAQNHVGVIDVALAQPLAADPHAANPAIGRMVLEHAGRIAGGGLILGVGEQDPSTARGADRVRADTVRIGGLAAGLKAGERLALLRREIDGRIVFTTSFGLEDQVITHLLWNGGIDVDVVTLDTGRLFPETYALWAETERRYGRRIRAVYPDRADLESLVDRQGIDGFYQSREARLACCHVRKVEPLGRALADASGWIAGLRAEQSAGRQDMGLVAADLARGLIKLNPLFDWTRADVAAFAAEHGVPVNPLHQRGFASIGCAPCTRAIGLGEPERAGRWWWEDEDKKECGLHVGRGVA